VKADGYAFDPWHASLQMDDGEIIEVSGISTNGIYKAAIDPRDMGPRRPLRGTATYSLVFDRDVSVDRQFVFALSLIAPDGTEVRLPTIRFRKGKVSYLATVP